MIKKTIITSLLLLIGIFLFAQGSIKIDVTGLNNNEGQLIILVFNNDDFGVDEEPFRRLKYTSISENKASFTIDNLEKGEYAFLIFHDEDENGECLTTWFGMPKEGVGTSGKTDSRPNYDNSKFSFDGENKSFNITLKYL